VVLLFTELFKLFVFSFFIFYFIESLVPGFFRNYFHLSYILLAAIISAIIVLWLKKDVEIKETSGGWWTVLVWAIIIALIIGVKSRDIGPWCYLLGIVAFIILMTVYKAIVNFIMFEKDRD
jgi:hypothetical protein